MCTNDMVPNILADLRKKDYWTCSICENKIPCGITERDYYTQFNVGTCEKCMRAIINEK